MTATAATRLTEPMAEPLHEILVKATLADLNGGNVTRVERGYLQIKGAFNASSNAWSIKANTYEGSLTALPTGNERSSSPKLNRKFAGARIYT